LQRRTRIVAGRNQAIFFNEFWWLGGRPSDICISGQLPSSRNGVAPVFSGRAPASGATLAQAGWPVTRTGRRFSSAAFRLARSVGYLASGCSTGKCLSWANREAGRDSPPPSLGWVNALRVYPGRPADGLATAPRSIENRGWPWGGCRFAASSRLFFSATRHPFDLSEVEIGRESTLPVTTKELPSGRMKTNATADISALLVFGSSGG